MRALPPAARAYIASVCALAAAVCAAPPAGLPAGPWTDQAPGATAVPSWPAVAALALLHAAGERIARGPRARNHARPATGAFPPMLLAGALLLPPDQAALVAVPGALASRVEHRPRAVRRAWRAGQSALSAAVASFAFRLLDGPDHLAALRVPGVLPPAAVAALALCLAATTLEAGISATAEHRRWTEAWRRGFARAAAPHLAHGALGLTTALLWRGPYGASAALLVLPPLYASCRLAARSDRERAAHRATVRALVRAIGVKDEYTRGHSERVGHASVLIARTIGMPEERIDAIRFAGSLHDVGKLAVPTRILRKPGPLTPAERRAVELHPEHGHEVVRGIGFLEEARAAVLHHHERLDGRGYPHGLAGERIPEAARLVAVADAFDSMTSTRSYRRARPVAAALEELERCAGTQFDPAMVAGLVRAIARHGWDFDTPPAVPVPAAGSGTSPARTGSAPATGSGIAPTAPPALTAPPAPAAGPGSTAGADAAEGAGVGPGSAPGPGSAAGRLSGADSPTGSPVDMGTAAGLAAEPGPGPGSAARAVRPTPATVGGQAPPATPSGETTTGRGVARAPWCRAGGRPVDGPEGGTVPRPGREANRSAGPTTRSADGGGNVSPGAEW